MWGCLSQLLCMDSLFLQGLVSVVPLAPNRWESLRFLSQTRESCLGNLYCTVNATLMG